MNYLANDKRYDTMPYRRCGKSGLKLLFVHGVPPFIAWC